MNVQPKESGTLEALMRAIGRAAREAAAVLREASPGAKTKALLAAADAIPARNAAILAANEEDMRMAAARNLTPAMLERLKLDKKRIAAMAT